MTLTFLENADVITVALDSYEYGIENSGATAVTLVSGGGGTAVVIPQSATSFVAAANGEFIKLTQLSDSVVYVFNRRFIQKVASAGGKARLVTGKGDFSFTANETYSAVKATLAAVPSGGSGTFTTLSGDVVSQTTGGATTIQPNVVTNAKAAQMAAHTFKGNDTGATANAKDLTISELKTDLSLQNVDNTSDANKPVSTATATALSGKQATLVSGTNLKTVNGTTLLGSGDLVISGVGGSTEYGITPTGSAGILIRIYGVASITAVKTNSSTITIAVPSVDGLQRADIYYPSAENAGANITLVVNYASNTTTNQGFSTIKPAAISMFSEAGLEYVPRASPAATDLSNTATATGGNLTHAIGGGNGGGIPAAIQTGNVKLVVKF